MTFFLDGEASDVSYRNLRSAEYESERTAREFVEELWAETAPYLDRDVQKGAMTDFVGRFWEMYTARELLRHDVPVVRSRDRDLRAGGPDLQIDDPIAFIECIAARAGSGPDGVSPPKQFVVTEVPRERIILRIRAAVHEKWQKYNAYLEKGTIVSTAPYVIAINGAGIPMARGEPTMPYVVQALLPFGRQQYHVSVDPLEIVGTSFELEYELKKLSGNSVATDIFLSEEYRGISAVLYAHVDPINRWDRIGNGFLLVHNPGAANPIPRDRLPSDMEFWVEDEHLHVTDRRPAQGAT